MAVIRAILLCFSMGLLWSGVVSAADGELASNAESFPEKDAKSMGGFELSNIRIPDVDSYLYPEPKKLEPRQGDELLSCVTLDDEIVGLLPLTYRTTPGFYDDPKVGAAILLTTMGVSLTDFFPEKLYQTDIPLGYALLAYPEYKKYKEDERIRRATFRIESLRRSKARLRCFET